METSRGERSCEGTVQRTHANVALSLRQLGDRGVLRGVRRESRSGVAEGSEDPWHCDPGFHRVCLYREEWCVGELPRDTDAVNPAPSGKPLIRALADA